MQTGLSRLVMALVPVLSRAVSPMLAVFECRPCVCSHPGLGLLQLARHLGGTQTNCDRTPMHRAHTLS